MAKRIINVQGINLNGNSAVLRVGAEGLSVSVAPHTPVLHVAQHNSMLYPAASQPASSHPPLVIVTEEMSALSGASVQHNLE